MWRPLFFFLFTLFFVHAGFSQYRTNDTLEIKQVVVTGNRVNVAKENVPLTVSVINEQELEQSQESKILPLISKKVPGVFVTERGITGFGVSQGSAGQINMRGVGGFPNTQVLMLIDGHPQYMGIFGHPLPDAYVTSDIKKVEVIRGPSSLLYGSNAMGGVINLITKEQEKDGFRGNARAMLGSYNTQKYMANGGFKKEGFKIFASVNHDRTNGHRDSSDFNITNGYLKTSYELNRHFKIKADASLAGFESQDPGIIGNTAGDFIDITRGRASFSVENQFPSIEGALKLYHNYGEHNISDGFHSTDQFTGIMLHETMRFIPNNMITLGGEYKNYGGMAENLKADIVFGEEKISELAAYFLVQHTFYKKLILNSGIRLENNSLYGTEMIPQFGFSYHPWRTTTLKGSVAKGFRSPTTRELYLFPPSNPDLKPERMWNYELGWLQDFFNKKLQVELTGFFIKGNNLIEVTGQYPNVINKNTGDFENYGVESSLNWRVSQKIDLNTNYTYIHTDEIRLATPKHQFNLNLDYLGKKLRLSINTEYINELYTVGEDYMNFGLSKPQKENYLVIDSKISYHYSSNLDIFLTGKNLTGSDYQISYGYPMPKQIIMGGVNVHF